MSDCESTLASPESLRTCAGSIVEGYLGTKPRSAEVSFELDCYPDWSRRPPQVSRRPVACTFEGHRLTISLCADDLVGLPSTVLSGWLDMELTMALLKQDDRTYSFNFSRDLLPLFPLTGSGIGYLRNMVEYMRSALLARFAADLIIDKKRDRTLTHYCFHRLGVRPEDAEDYRDALRHGWQRAFILLRKLEELAPIVELEHRGCLSGGRAAFWESHSYIQDGDRRLLDDWTRIAADDSFASFSQRMTALFTAVRDGLLVSARSPNPDKAIKGSA